MQRLQVLRRGKDVAILRHGSDNSVDAGAQE